MTESFQRFVIWSCGGTGREVAWLLSRRYAGDPDLSIAFADASDNAIGHLVNGHPVISYDDARRRCDGWTMINAVGSPSSRAAFADRFHADNWKNCVLADPTALLAPSSFADEGTVLFAGSTVSTNCRLGQGCHVNYGATISHDVEIGDFTSISPGVHIAGRVRIGRRVLIGIGASIRNGELDRPLVIGDDAIVGAGAVVAGDVAAGSVVAGVPARLTRI